MRTTLSLDDDIIIAAREQARREGRSLGAVVSDLARQALTSDPSREGNNDRDEFFGFRPLPHRGDAISNALIDQLRDDDEVA